MELSYPSHSDVVHLAVESNRSGSLGSLPGELQSLGSLHDLDLIALGGAAKAESLGCLVRGDERSMGVVIIQEQEEGPVGRTLSESHPKASRLMTAAVFRDPTSPGANLIE